MNLSTLFVITNIAFTNAFKFNLDQNINLDFGNGLLSQIVKSNFETNEINENVTNFTISFTTGFPNNDYLDVYKLNYTFQGQFNKTQDNILSGEYIVNNFIIIPFEYDFEIKTTKGNFYGMENDTHYYIKIDDMIDISITKPISIDLKDWSYINDTPFPIGIINDIHYDECMRIKINNSESYKIDFCKIKSGDFRISFEISDVSIFDLEFTKGVFCLIGVDSNLFKTSKLIESILIKVSNSISYKNINNIDEAIEFLKYIWNLSYDKYDEYFELKFTTPLAKTYS